MHVCPNCFNDFELKSFIEAASMEEGNCKFCKSQNAPPIAITEILDFFEEFFNLFVVDAEGRSMIDIIQEDWNLFKDAVIGEQMINAIPLFIDFPYDYTNDSIIKVQYSPNIKENVSHWETLKDKLKWEQRYILDLDSLKDFEWDRFFNDFFIYNYTVPFYRARIHHNESENAYQCSKMGSPDKTKVSSGRANPQGIPYLYLSRDKETTFYETRALFKDEVSIGEFRIREDEELYLVDFTEKASAYEGYVGLEDLKYYTKKILLKELISKDLSKPIRRYDSEIEYVPTQFICEFDRNMSKADGIIFDSSLHEGGKNIVLFNPHKVNCVKVEKHLVNRLNIQSELLV